MAERKNPVVNWKQAAVVEPALDHSLPKPNIRQLAMRHYPMLSFNDLPECPSRRRPLQMRIKFASYFIENLMRMEVSWHSPDGGRRERASVALIGKSGGAVWSVFGAGM